MSDIRFVMIGIVVITAGFIILGPVFGIMGLASVFVLSVTLEAVLLLCITKIKKF